MPTHRSPFAGYNYLSLPDLSTQRRPPRSRGLASTHVHPRCTDKVLLVALARCLGAYCSSNDVLLAWQPALNPPTLTATRVSWERSVTWEHVLQNLAFKDTHDDPESIHRTLGLDLDPGQNPFLAIVSSNNDYDHPLVASLETGGCSDDSTSIVHLKYSTLAFHASTAELLAAQLRYIVAHILAHPSSSPASLAFLPRALQSAVPLRTDGSSYTHYPEVRTVADFLPRHNPAVDALEFYPNLYEEDPVAFERAVQHLTYGELHMHSNRFAAYLCAQGLELEDRVALCMLRGIEFHVAMMGVFKAGGCYVPIDPELPEERQIFISIDSGARFVFTADNIQAHIAASQAYPTDDINNAQRDRLAYLLYTSGTTGAPKGCLLTHDGFAQAIHALSWFANQAGPNKCRWPQAGRYLAVASVAFDVHLAETFVGFSLGMTVVSAPRAQLLEDLPRWLHRLRITHVGIVPSLIEATMHAIAESAEFSADDSGKGDTTRENRTMELAYIASGGEKMSDSILERWADHPLVTLANFYGPSEVTIGCSARLMTSNTRKESVGRIFENCSAYVVDENLNTVIRGGVGELLVGGRLVGRGYHGRPDLTEKAFIKWEGERVYRTGDLVRLMPDDTLEILGRIDTQIKLRGVRIESEGVSSVIRDAAMGFPGLATTSVPDVATILVRHPRLQTDQLVSFFAWDSSITIAHRRSAKPHVLARAPPGLMRALRDACVRELASYMRPAHVIPLDFLPLNTNGKTDAKALAALFQAESLEVLGAAGARHEDAGKAQVQAPRRVLTEREFQIANLVAHYTAVPTDQFVPSSDLFELGLDSLKLVRLAAEMRAVIGLGSSVSVSSLVQHPTVEELAVLVQDSQNSQSSATETPRESTVSAFAQQWKAEVEEAVAAEKIESVLPTFPVQDGVLYRSADITALYVQHVVLKIYEDVDVEKLKSAWNKLMSRHEILRTIFLFASAVVQVVLKAEACELPWQERMTKAEDVDRFSSDFITGDGLELASNINENISTTPPFRLVLYRSERVAAPLLTLSIHHAIYDGISLPLLLKDAEALYLGGELRPPAPLAKVLDAIYDVDLDEAAGFWNSTFDGFDWSKVPRRLASGEVANTVSIQFEKGRQDWEAKAAEAKVSLQALLMASFGASLGNHLYGSPDVVFGVIRSGRSFAEDEMNEAQAPLLSVLPARVKATGDADVLRAVQRSIGDVLAFEHVPLRRMQQWLQPGRSLFEALFSVSIDDGADTRIWDVLQSSQPQADYILAVEIVLNRKTGEIRVDCAYTNPLSREFIDHLLTDIEATSILLAEGNHLACHRTPAVFKPAEKAAEGDSDAEDGSVGPVDHALEEKTSMLVAQFLKIEKEQISTTASLIALGLDSIKSIGLTRALRREGMRITALELMRRPTIRRIAARQATTADSPDNVEAEEKTLLKNRRTEILKHVDGKFELLDETDKVELYPVTVLQAGMLSQTINSGGHLYIHAFPFKLSTSIDIDRLQRAWQSALQYFSSLRTSFHFLTELGIWIQAVHSVANLKWSEVETPDDESLLTSVEKYIASIDFSSDVKLATPPVYLRLYRGSGGAVEPSHTLMLVIHHALYDGISMSVLSDVLKAFYHGEEPAPIPQFVDLLGYFEYQERHGTEYWMKHLHDFKRPVLPRSGSGTASQAVSASFEIPITSARLSETCRLFDATAQCLGQAALAKILTKLYNRRDVVFGHVVSGRNVAQAESVLGPMISTLPCRVRITPELNNLDFVRSIHRHNMSAQKWQHASLRSIQRKLELSSLWDSIFVFQPILDDESDGKEELWHFDDSEDEVAKIQYPLNIELHQRVDRLVIKAAVQSDMMLAKHLDDMLREFSDVFISIVDKPSDIVLPDIPVDEEQYPHFSGKTHGHVKGVNGHTNGSVDSLRSDPQVSTFIEILAVSINVSKSYIEPDTPLISLGVDSISALQISAKARKAGLSIHAADVLCCQTPADVLIILKSKDGKAAVETQQKAHTLAPELESSLLQRLNVSTDTVEGILPASAGMKWLIGMWQLSDRSRFQHAFVFGLPGDVDEGKLKSAWSSLVKAHGILRSTFASTNAFDVHVVTFKELPKKHLWSSRVVSDDRPTDEIIAGIMKELVSSPLSTDLPPIQVLFLHCHGSNYFIVHLHHFQYDAWSMRLLMADFRSLYLGERAVNSSNLARFLQSCSTLSREEEQRQYWQSYLQAPFAPSLLPKLTAGNNHDRFVYIDRKALQNVPILRQRAQNMLLSLNAVFLACWARVQAKYSNTSSATFGLWHLGRSGVVDDIAALAVPCMNVLPIHVDGFDPSLRELSGRIQATLRQRPAVAEQSHLEDINRWSGGDDKRTLLNVFVNIVTTAELDDVEEDNGFDNLLSPINMPYFIPETPEAEASPTTERLAVCNLMEEAVMIDFVTDGQNLTASVEYMSDYLDSDKCRELVAAWAQLVNETLKG